jgi:hypothetical protein
MKGMVPELIMTLFVRDLIAGPEFSAPWSAEPAELN